MGNTMFDMLYEKYVNSPLSLSRNEYFFLTTLLIQKYNDLVEDFNKTVKQKLTPNYRNGKNINTCV